MKMLITLLATASMFFFFMLGHSAFSIPQHYTEDPKFMDRVEPLLGLNVKELREILGTPEEINSERCPTLLQLDRDEFPMAVSENTWIYSHEIGVVSLTMEICIVNDYVVGEQRSIGSIEGSRVFVQTQTLVDVDLMEKAYRKELDKGLHEDKLYHNGPAYEI